MKRKRILALLFGVFCAFPSFISAQSPNKIIKQANSALGGEKILQNLKSFQKTGKITRLKDGATGNYKMQAESPNFYNVEFDLGGFETETGYNGKSGWRRDSRDGLRTLTGNTSRDFQAETNYRNNLWLNYKKEKAKITLGGQSPYKRKIGKFA